MPLSAPSDSVSSDFSNLECSINSPGLPSPGYHSTAQSSSLDLSLLFQSLVQDKEHFTESSKAFSSSKASSPTNQLCDLDKDS